MKPMSSRGGSQKVALAVLELEQYPGKESSKDEVRNYIQLLLRAKRVALGSWTWLPRLSISGRTINIIPSPILILKLRKLGLDCSDSKAVALEIVLARVVSCLSLAFVSNG